MSQVLGLEELVAVADGFGTVPLLLTVDESGRPRAAAVTVGWERPVSREGAAGEDGAVAVVHAGHRSLANARQRPLVSLLWPAPPGERFALLVDGEVRDVRDDPPAEPATPPNPGRAPKPGRSPKAGGTISLHVSSAILHVVSA